MVNGGSCDAGRFLIDSATERHPREENSCVVSNVKGRGDELPKLTRLKA